MTAVDDDLEMLGFLRTILEAVREGDDCRDGDRRAADAEPARADVLVADLGMPVMDGFSLIRRVRHASDPHVRGIPRWR